LIVLGGCIGDQLSEMMMDCESAGQETVCHEDHELIETEQATLTVQVTDYWTTGSGPIYFCYLISLIVASLQP